MLDHWQSVARATPLVILTDFDGTLIPFAPTPEAAVPDAPLRELLASLAALPGLSVFVVSGRTHDVLERYFPEPTLGLVAEHGAWWRAPGGWQATIDLDPAPVQRLADELEAIARPVHGARVERKTFSCALHERQVASGAREALRASAQSAIERLLGADPRFERVDGDHVIEVRAAAARKSIAVSLVREQLGTARLIAIGDDLTDEHMFGAVEPDDETVLVRSGPPRRSLARWEVPGVAEVRQLLAFIRDARRGAQPGPLPLKRHAAAAARSAGPQG